MGEWLIGIGGVVTFWVVVAAAHVALFGGDQDRREMGYRVLKLMVGTATGLAGLVVAAVKLAEAGLL